MRKPELVFLHSLLVLVRDRLERDGAVPPDAFDGYDDSGVTPASIDRRKAAHETAIRALLAGILTTIAATEDTEDRTPVEADD